MSGCQTEIPVKSILGVQIYTSAFEIRIESFLCFPILRVEFMQFVLFNVKRSDITFGLQDTGTAFLYGVVEQTTAHQIYQSVRRDTGSVFRKKLRMLLDERYYIVEFLLRWLETALSVGRHYELVATDTPSVAVRADIRRVAKAVPPVQAVTRINKHVLNV